MAFKDFMGAIGQPLAMFDNWNNRRHQKQLQREGMQHASQQGELNRQHQSQMQNAMLGFQGQDRPASRTHDRYMGDRGMEQQMAAMMWQDYMRHGDEAFRGAGIPIPYTREFFDYMARPTTSFSPEEGTAVNPYQRIGGM